MLSGMDAKDISASLQSTKNIAIYTITGTIKLAIPSGNECAKRTSKLPISSTNIFLIAPVPFSSIAPKGRFSIFFCRDVLSPNNVLYAAL